MNPAKSSLDEQTLACGEVRDFHAEVLGQLIVGLALRFIARIDVVIEQDNAAENDLRPEILESCHFRNGRVHIKMKIGIPASRGFEGGCWVQCP